MLCVQLKKTLQVEGFFRDHLLTELILEREPIDTRFGQEVIPEINNEQASWCRKVDWKISHNGQSSFGETTVCRNTITGEWEPIISMSTM